MLYYLFIYASSCFFFALGIKGVMRNKLSEKIVTTILLTISALILVLFSSFRDVSVGTDTIVYQRFFLNLKTEDFLLDIDYFNEFGFVFIRYLSKVIIDNFHFNLFVISSIVVLLSFLSIIRLSESKIYSLVVFFLLGFYVFHFNAERQAITVAMVLFSLRYIVNREFSKFLVVIILGVTIHKSIVLCIPLYFLYGYKFTLSRFTLFAMLISGMLLLIVPFVEFASNSIDSRYGEFYIEQESSGGLYQSIFILLLFIFCFIHRVLSEKNDYFYDFLLYMLLIGCLINVYSVIMKLDPNGVARSSIYYTQSLIFLLPSVLISIKGRAGKILNIIFITGFLFYSIFSLARFSNLVPYTINGIL
ncbi:EpsG family protein [Vibrio sp. Evd11]|uniref:EpsG family protein n=1 Tax=Vibrio sp. Evd11 TaxID=1207404 RepID=UPI000EFD9995|nr:EpsG family protein [Vibrio sp. Evd11]